MSKIISLVQISAQVLILPNCLVLTTLSWKHHNPIQTDYDPRCDRYHSGNRVTHNARNGVEESGDVGCYESNLGPKPWGPATEVRIGLIDPERGIVIGYAILYYGDSPRRMQINEVFKILDGRIRMVDNIGLMEDGITTSGFTR